MSCSDVEMTTKSTVQSSSSFRWMLVAIGFVINICLGSIYSYSVFRKPLEALWRISSTESGLPYMVFLAMFAFTMPVVGGFLDRFGPRITVIIGSILVGAGWCLASLSNNILLLTILYGVVGGAGVGVVYGAPIAVAARWFPERAGTAMGLTLLGFGLSPLITAPIMSSLISSVGPLQTFLYLGIAFLIILLVLSMPLKFPSSSSAPSAKQTTAAQAAARKEGQLDRSEMLRTKTFYALWIAYTLGCLSGLMAIGIAAPFGLEVAKISQQASSIAVSVFAIFNGFGRPLFGWLTDRLKPRNTAVLSFLTISVVAALLYAFGEGNAIIYFVCFSVLWLNLGGWLAIAPTATKIFFGTKYYGKNYGVVFTSYGVGAILGMLSSGWLKDTTGTYLTVFPVVSVLAIVGLITACIGLRPPRR